MTLPTDIKTRIKIDEFGMTSADEGFDNMYGPQSILDCKGIFFSKGVTPKSMPKNMMITHKQQLHSHTQNIF